LGCFHDGCGNAPTLRQLDALTLQDAIYDPAHGLKAGDLLIKLLSFSARKFLPPTRRLDAGTEPVQQMAHFIQPGPQACASRSNVSQ
jgi:hypothetical protein